MLSVREVAGQSAVLKGNSGVDEGRCTTVVVHEERLAEEHTVTQNNIY